MRIGFSGWGVQPGFGKVITGGLIHAVGLQPALHPETAAFGMLDIN